LPEKFYFDSVSIISAIGVADLSVGDSYSSTSYVYSLMGFYDNSVLFSVVSGSSFLFLCLFHVVKIHPARISIYRLPLIVFLLLLGCSYLTIVTKEFIVLILMGLFSLSFRSNSIVLKALWVGTALL